MELGLISRGGIIWLEHRQTRAATYWLRQVLRFSGGPPVGSPPAAPCRVPSPARPVDGGCPKGEESFRSSSTVKRSSSSGAVPEVSRMSRSTRCVLPELEAEASLHGQKPGNRAAGVSTGAAPEAVESLATRHLWIDRTSIRASCCSSCGSRLRRKVRRSAWLVVSGKVMRSASGTELQETDSSGKWCP